MRIQEVLQVIMESIQALIRQKRGRIDVAPGRVWDALVRRIINKQCSSMSGLLWMRHWVHPAPLKKSAQVLHKKTWFDIHGTRKVFALRIFQDVTHLLPEHELRLSTTFEEVMNKRLEILQKLRWPYDNMEVREHKTQEASQPFSRYMMALNGRNSGATSPLIMGLCCDSRAFLVLTLSNFADLTRIPLTSSTNHIFSLRWTTVLGEVRIWRWQNR
jgi:hypothetical protein